MSATYKIGSELITDVCCNGNGDISAWEDNLNLNSFTDWNPELSYNMQIMGIVNFSNQHQLAKRHVNNYGELIDAENALITVLQNAVYSEFVPPVSDAPLFKGYIVNGNEEIRDITINGTGTILNWEQILNDNSFTDWNPDLYVNQQIILSQSDEMQPNILNQLANRHINNYVGISDFDEQINSLMTIFAQHMLFDYEGEIMAFEPDGNELIFD